jgi:hypothetical protein
MAESTDAKFLGNFRKEIDVFKADPNYNPSNPALAVAALEAQYAAGLAAVEDIPTHLHPHKININERQEIFAEAVARTRRARGILKSSGATAKEVEDAMTLIRKVLGQRLKPAVEDNPDTPENEASASHSAAQLSYDSQTQNVRSLGEFLGNVTAYSPNEAPLKSSAFGTIADQMQASSDAVSTSRAPLSNARRVRDELLYTNENSIYVTARAAKEYYKGLYGANSPQFKQISALEFKLPRKLYVS